MYPSRFPVLSLAPNRMSPFFVTNLSSTCALSSMRNLIGLMSHGMAFPDLVFTHRIGIPQLLHVVLNIVILHQPGFLKYRHKEIVAVHGLKLPLSFLFKFQIMISSVVQRSVALPAQVDRQTVPIRHLPVWPMQHVMQLGSAMLSANVTDPLAVSFDDALHLPPFNVPKVPRFTGLSPLFRCAGQWSSAATFPSSGSLNTYVRPG